MTNDLFQEGGPLNIKKTGPDQATMSIPMSYGSDGRFARECPNEDCCPGYFKVRNGTGITENHIEAFCPYCRHTAEPGDFRTKEQVRYAKDHVLQEVNNGLDRMFKDVFKLGPSGRRTVNGGMISMEITHKSSPQRPIRKPVEEQLRRDVVCPSCGLDHSVYGLATWCADCGTDIFLTHVDAELDVITMMLGDVPRRREILGERIVAKDLENCLEDTVSIFEVVVKIITRRSFVKRQMPAEEIDQLFRQNGNCFQSVSRTINFLTTNFQTQGMPGLSAAEADTLRLIFEKRHPITHNLGVIDSKYLERVSSLEQEGQEVKITEDEISQAMEMIQRIFRELMSQFC